MVYETNLPTQQKASGKKARLPLEDAHSGNPARAQTSPCQREKTIDRLTRSQLDGLFKRVKPVKTANFSYRMKPAPALATAVVVPKSVSTKATVRNRLRRKVKGALQALERQGATGELVVVVHKPFALPFTELKGELARCFKP